MFLDPVPADLASFYPSDYHAADLPSLSELMGAARIVESYKLELIRRFAPSGRLLEIGPGLGGFASLAKEAGYEVEAIELDETCCAFLSEVVGVRAIQSHSPESAIPIQGSYDVVALWHVLEHLSDPIGTLEAATTSLTPGGIVVIATPNPDALQFRLLRRWWAHVDAPRHLTLTPLSVLARQIRERGLVVAFHTSTDEGGIRWNLFGWQESFANMTQARRMKPVARVLGTAVAYAIAPIERTGLRGATYTIVLRKESAP